MTDHLESDDIQGLLARGYRRLSYASYLMVQITDPPSARPVLHRWSAQVTSARESSEGTAINIAVTASGVAALTGTPPLGIGFSEPFSTGMVTENRSRLLGDIGDNAPATWCWGGPTCDPIHVAVLLYAATESQLSDLTARIVDSIGTAGLRVVQVLGTEKLSDKEPFGFHDGLSQPVIAEFSSEDRDGDVVKSGEFVLGYVNEYAQHSDRPLVPAEADPWRMLPRDPGGSGAADLGRNGTYLVFRQLHQDVEAFEDYLTRTAAGYGPSDPDAKERLAAKLVGRWRGTGAPLTLSPDFDDSTYAKANNFAYHELDAHGLRCPVGAHIRRANPRDSLAPNPGTEDSRQVNRRHRLLRRGRVYGPGDDTSPGAARGLHFICLNANLARQYEFVQHSWINDANFAGLVGVEDPLIGPRSHGPSDFTEPALPVRRRYHGLPQFVRVKGGAYFFLPGLRALRYLTSEPPDS